MDFSTFFEGGLFYSLGTGIWNIAVDLIGATASQTPESFSSSAWYYVTDNVMSWTLSFAAVLLNIMYMVGIMRQSSNLKENFTLEIMVDSFIKVIAGNFLMLNGTNLMSIMFKIASLMSGGFLLDNNISFQQADLDMGSRLFDILFGMTYFVVCLVCAVTIFLTVYGRYLQLYLLAAVGPFAWSTVPAGHGISSVASSWIRTFLAKCFEIVIIALAVSIASVLCNSINFGQLSGWAEHVDGAIQSLQSMATMVILTGMVKGADVFMRRTFGF